VNGLRDTDAESSYPSRASYASEYSMHDSASDGLQIMFKEHNRGDSKGSMSSFVSPAKKQALGNHRPETKVTTF
jgi:serine/arginine repetitive matrix protein 2